MNNEEALVVLRAELAVKNAERTALNEAINEIMAYPDAAKTAAAIRDATKTKALIGGADISAWDGKAAPVPVEEEE